MPTDVHSAPLRLLISARKSRTQCLAVSKRRCFTRSEWRTCNSCHSIILSVASSSFLSSFNEQGREKQEFCAHLSSWKKKKKRGEGKVMSQKNKNLGQLRTRFLDELVAYRGQSSRGFFLSFFLCLYIQRNRFKGILLFLCGYNEM